MCRNEERFLLGLAQYYPISRALKSLQGISRRTYLQDLVGMRLGLVNLPDEPLFLNPALGCRAQHERQVAVSGPLRVLAY